MMGAHAGGRDHMGRQEAREQMLAFLQHLTLRGTKQEPTRITSMSPTGCNSSDMTTSDWALPLRVLSLPTAY